MNRHRRVNEGDGPLIEQQGVRSKLNSDPRSGRDNVLPSENTVRRYLRVMDRNQASYDIVPEAGSAVQYPFFDVDVDVDGATLLLIPRVAVKMEEMRNTARKLIRKNDKIVIRRLCRGLAKEIGFCPKAIEPLFDLTITPGVSRLNYCKVPVFGVSEIEAAKRLAQLFWVGGVPRAYPLAESRVDRGQVVWLSDVC